MAIITISRGTFSGGKKVAERLAGQLGYSCVSREMMITEASESFDLKTTQLDDSMVEAPSILSSDRSISAANVNFVRYVLLKKIGKLDLVYHGLAGDLLLSGVKKLLRVRIIASTEYRIKAAMENHGIDHQEAMKMIERLDSRRNKWAQVVLGASWHDPSLYDVSVNLDYMSIDSAVDTIARLSKRPEFTPDETTTQSLEDLILSSNVWAAVTRKKQSWALYIHVVARNGVVTIYGDVASRKLSEAICILAEEVDGVEEVVNNINVGIKWLM